MSVRDTINFSYFLSKDSKGKQSSELSLDEKKLNKLLHLLANQSMKEKTPTLDELEKILQESVNSKQENETQESVDFKDQDEFGGSSSIIHLLSQMGYLTNSKKWLTTKGFFEIGKQILQDVMNNLKSSEFGLHEIRNSGGGSVTIDTTKKLESGDDLKHLSVPQTLLNSIQRISKSTSKVEFPIDIGIDDFEKFETLDEVRAAVVYCIDLSSTMKYSLGNNINRIEAAKRALWSLYVFNKKFFPNDSIFIVGFASMASNVKPMDIPYLKTFDANDNFLHYTNYQAAFRLARKILKKISAENKRIVLITDGQPSACFIENEFQKKEIISEKPYSNFYIPDESIINKIKEEKEMKLDSDPNRLVYLCYRYKKVDQKIHQRTIIEAKKCKKDRIDIDTVIVSDEVELLDYAIELEKELRGKTYHIQNAEIDRILVTDYLNNTKKVLISKQSI